MSGTKTLIMIKPTAVRKGYIGPILGKIAEGGFNIKALKYTNLSLEPFMQYMLKDHFMES